MRKTLLIALLPLALGCGGSEAESECRWLEQPVGGAGDTLVSLTLDSYVMLSNAGSEPALIRVREGLIAFSALDAGCLPTKDAPCGYDLRRLRIVLGAFSIGEIEVENYSLLLSGPATLSDSGGGLDLTRAGKAKACARFDGELAAADSVTLDFGSALVDAAQQSFALDLAYSSAFELEDGPPVVELFLGGARVELSATLSGDGEQPWTRP